MALLLVPLPSSHYPLQKTKGPRDHDSFYHPVLLKVALHQGAPAGGLPCSRVMLQAPSSRDGLAVAFLERAPAELLAQQRLTCLISCQVLSCCSQTASHPAPLAEEGQRLSLPGHQPQPLHQEPPRNSLPRLPPAKPRSDPAVQRPFPFWHSALSCVFSPSAILLRFLTFKPISQLLLSVLTGSCWLNPWAQRQPKHLPGTSAYFQ